MIWLLTRPVVWPVKTAAFSAAAGYKTGRLVGYRRLFVFGLGVAVGVLVSRPELRDRIASKVRAVEPVPPPAPTAVAESIDLTD